jgi:2-polyprenyl-6-methoxyphenol hydroxylase-like FAD-dependent oxidoreductase
MAKKTVLISGIGIAGPTLAYWLWRRGFEPVLIERAPKLRAGGYVIDFWGVGFEVAERMELIPTLRDVGYMNDRIVFVRQDGRIRSAFGGNALRRTLGDRFLSIQRGDLARAIYETIKHETETVFGDEIIGMAQDADHVEVRFKRGTARSFDFVIGADGLHSPLRTGMFDWRESIERYLGYYVAVFVTGGYSKRDEHTYLSYAAPGRQISRFALRGNRTGFLFAFARPYKDSAFVQDTTSQKRALIETFSHEPWVEWPEIKSHLEACDDLYFDAMSQIELPAWSRGRVALVGDAAYCPSLLAGEGSAFAMVGAYILAGELQRARSDYTRAFAAYERSFRPFIERKQRSARAFASSFVPLTSFGLFVRDVILHLGRIPIVSDFLARRFVIDRFELPIYDPVQTAP